MSYLLIHNGVVVDVVQESFPVHSDMVWVEGTANVGDTYENSIVIPKEEQQEPTKTYADNRLDKYTENFSIGDQIDLIQKQLQSMIDLGEITAVPETTVWLSTLEQIKIDYPKPNENANTNAEK